MNISYPRPLKVSTPDGKRIVAKITSVPGGKVKILIPFLDEVKRDDPPFAKDGVIKMQCTRIDYVNVIRKVTHYIENLFLKGMADEDIDPSVSPQLDPGTTEGDDPEREDGSAEGEGDSPSVYSGARGSESTKSSGRRKSSSSVAESGDPETERKDQ